MQEHITVLHSPRYYEEEIGIENYEWIARTCDIFTRIVIDAYNILFEQKYLDRSISNGYKTVNKYLYDRHHDAKFELINSAVARAKEMLKSQNELIDLHIDEKQSAIKKKEKKIKGLEKQLKHKTKLKQSIVYYFATEKWKIPYRNCPYKPDGQIMYHRKSVINELQQFEYDLNRQIRRIKQRIHNIQFSIRRIEDKIYNLKNHIPKRIVFGGKKLFKQKDTVGLDDQWYAKMRNARSNTYTIYGRNDNPVGNWMFQYIFDKNSLDVKVPIAKHMHIKLTNFTLPYGMFDYLEQLSRPVPIRYTVKQRSDGHGRRYLEIQICIKRPSYDGNYSTADGIVSIDVNADHIAMTELDSQGNCIDKQVLPFHVLNKNSGQTYQILSDTLERVALKCRLTNKPLAMEDLDFKKKKASMQYDNKKKNRILSQLAYSQINELMASKAYRDGFEIIKVNPSYTSFIGKLKYMKKLGTSIHVAAAYTIGCRAMKIDGYDQIPLPYTALAFKSKQTELYGQWKYLYKHFKNFDTHSFYRIPEWYQFKTLAEASAFLEA